MSVSLKPFNENPVAGNRVLMYMRRLADRKDYNAFVFAGFTSFSFAMEVDTDSIQYGGASGLVSKPTAGAPTWTASLEYIQSLSVAAQDMLETIALSGNVQEPIQVWLRFPDVVAGSGQVDDTGKAVPEDYQLDRMAVVHMTSYEMELDPTASVENSIEFAMDQAYVRSWLPPVSASEMKDRLMNDGLKPWDDATRGGSYEYSTNADQEFDINDVDDSQFAFGTAKTANAEIPTVESGRAKPDKKSEDDEATK